MSSAFGKITLPGAVVYVSYGKPTKLDDVGCDGMYIEKVEIINMFLFLLWNKWKELIEA